MMPHSTPASPVSVLLVSAAAENCCALAGIFRDAGWRLNTVSSLRQAVERSRSSALSVVIADTDLPDGNWRHLLASLQDIPQAPRLIVCSRLADERLWAEVLNLGAFDLISTPFELREIDHVIGHAWQSWHSEWKPAPRCGAATQGLRAIAARQGQVA